MTHQGSHIANVCRFCGLYDAYWNDIPKCPGRKAWEARQSQAKKATEFRIEFLGGDANWKVYCTTSNRQNAIQKARELASVTGRRHFVRISTKTGDRTLYRTTNQP